MTINKLGLGLVTIGLGVIATIAIASSKKNKKPVTVKKEKVYKDNIERYYDIGLTEEEKERLWKEYQEEIKNKRK